MGRGSRGRALDSVRARYRVRCRARVMVWTRVGMHVLELTLRHLRH